MLILPLIHAAHYGPVVLVVADPAAVTAAVIPILLNSLHGAPAIGARAGVVYAVCGYYPWCPF